MAGQLAEQEQLGRVGFSLRARLQTSMHNVYRATAYEWQELKSPSNHERQLTSCLLRRCACFKLVCSVLDV